MDLNLIIGVVRPASIVYHAFTYTVIQVSSIERNEHDKS